MTEREQVIAELLYLKHDCLEGSATDQTLDKAIALLKAQEPVYPTWKEWLEEQRVVVHFDSVNAKGKKVKWELTNKSNCPIPADIAQMLGIEPKK